MTSVKGILGTKLGMTQVFDDTRAVPVTVIKAGPCVVAQIKTRAARRLRRRAARVRRRAPEPGHEADAGPLRGATPAEPRRHLVELRTDDAGSYEPGQELRADVFEAGDLVDVVGSRRARGSRA